MSEVTLEGTQSGLGRAPTFCVIIGIKLLKAMFLTVLAYSAYKLSDNNLPTEYHKFLIWIQHFKFIPLNPENKFWVDLAGKVEALTEAQVLRVALGTFIYSLFAWVEGIGLIFRVSWAGWLAIGESAFFIPIEILDLIHGFSTTIFVILILNIVIVAYLYQNRQRLFHHNHS